MPQLSPSMSEAKILRWYISEGEHLEMTQLLALVEVDRLLSDPSQHTGPTEMQIEGHEEGIIAQLLLNEGDVASPGEPIALLCESADDVPQFEGIDPPEDVSDSMFVWQAYVADAKDAQEHCRIPEHNKVRQEE